MTSASRTRTIIRVLLVAVAVIAVAGVGGVVVLKRSIDAYSGSGFDHRRFDTLEADFARDQAAFVAAAGRMKELAAKNPGAVRIGWSLALICVRTADPGALGDDCDQTSDADQALFKAMPSNSDVVVGQAKDPGRTFFRFFQNDPPMYTIMFAPGDADPDRYVKDRDFRDHRALAAGWTLLAPISDNDKDNQQWLH